MSIEVVFSLVLIIVSAFAFGYRTGYDKGRDDRQLRSWKRMWGPL